MYKIEHYQLADDGRDAYAEWLVKLRDTTAKIAIIRRVARMELGNFGDHKFCRDGVFELRIDVGASYRVYYALEHDRVVLLLCGGNKSTQGSDIKQACQNRQAWRSQA